MPEHYDQETIRHSTAHILAAAVTKLFPTTKFATGPATETGFYYDIDLAKKISSKDFAKIEKKMQKIIEANEPFIKEDISIKEAKKLFKKLKQPYKLELIDDLIKEEKVKKVSIYRTGDFVDLCKGPHIKSTKDINPKGIKITKIAGAYWRADEKNTMLQRIYGVVFKNPKELRNYLHMIKEAKKRDHRKLGKELDLFVFSNIIGKGLPLFTPKGTIIWKELEKFVIEEEEKRGYIRTLTPDLTRVELYKISGHWEHYREDMYPPMNVYDDEYVLRPMTCPHQFELFKSRKRSYRELPLRYAELAKLYRMEKSGELSGLIRHAGGWTLADAHIICEPEQMEKEFEDVVDLISYLMKKLKIEEYWYRFSKWDHKNKKGKYVDNPKAWEDTQKSMKKILDKLDLNYVEAEDEAAFYGPKLDVQMKNVNGKEDTAFTIQIDFAMPERFNMVYIDKNGKQKRPMVIHRASIGCIERTMAFLIEKYAGAFPVWLAPIQAAILPVSEKFNKYAETVADQLKKHSLRVEINNSDDSLGKRIRESQKQKIPYMLVVGEKEEKGNSVAVRNREKGDQGTFLFEKFTKKILNEIEKKQ
jgi:threonyl-tRNA synthetase